MNLYELDFEIESLLRSLVDPDTGEINEDVFAQIEALQMESDRKLRNAICAVKNLNAFANALREEEKRKAERRKTIEKQAERLSRYAETFLDGKPLETAEFKVSFRKSEKAVIDDITKIPQAYLNYGDPTADKNAIKAAIKAGKKIEGAHVEETNSMSIK